MPNAPRGPRSFSCGMSRTGPRLGIGEDHVAPDVTSHVVEHGGQLVVLEDRPWVDWLGGRPITQARVARLLRPFGIHPMKLRFGARTANGYTKRMFTDSWSRYLPRTVE